MWVRTCSRLVASGLSRLRKPTDFHCKYSSNASILTQGSYQIDSKLKKIVPLNPPSEHTPYTLTEEDEELITGGGREKSNKLHELILKLYMKRQEGFYLPEQVRIEDFQIMLDLNPRRLKTMLQYLVKRHRAQMKEKLAKQEYHDNLAAVREERIARLSELEHPWLEYKLHLNSLVPRIYKVNLTRFFNVNMAMGLEFGQKIVMDCSFDHMMDDVRIKNTAKQILLCSTLNRKNRRPFALHLCNLDRESRLMYHLRRLNPEVEYDLPIIIHKCSYLDVFEKKRLVYLSPHAQRPITYDPDDIYILGAFVDCGHGAQMQITNKKAEKERIRCSALPLSRHVQWLKGSKSLCVNQVFHALLTVKNTGDWGRALLDALPSRKHMPLH